MWISYTVDDQITITHYLIDQLYEQLKPVLSDEEESPVLLEDVYVSSIEDPKITSSLMKYL